MTRTTHPMIKKATLAAALTCGLIGVANADDGSIARFGGDSYTYFAQQPVDRAPSEWRQANPRGLPESVFQAYSAPGPAWQLNKPVFASASSDPSFRRTHPNGLSEQEIQALSSDAVAFQSPTEARIATATNSEVDAAQGANKRTFAARVADFFHFAEHREE